MLRAFLLTALFTITSALSALETPLVIRPPNTGSDYVVVANASLGTIQLYRANNQQLEQRDAHNFLADLDYLSKVPVPGKREWTMLRTGSTTTTPTYGDMFNQYPKPPRGSDLSPLADRALTTEDQFWAKPPAYDGVVRGAMLDNALVLVIPSTYTLLFYTIMGDEFTLAGWRNYRIDLYIPQVFNSTPTPQEILRQLPPDVQQERKDALDQQMQDLGEQAGEIIPLSESDAWIASSQQAGQLFALVDAANKRMVTYSFRTRGKTAELQMMSVRNLEIDLMIPTTLNSIPDVAALVKNYNGHLKKAKIPPVSREYLESLLDQQSVAADGASDFHAVLDPSGILILDFPSQRQLLTYRSFGAGNGSELIGARDYSVEAGIGIHRQQLQRVVQAERLLPSIKNAARDKNVDEAFRIAEIALEWHPGLYQKIEKDAGSRVMSKDPRWQPMIEAAIAETERREQAAKQLAEESARRAAERAERLKR